MVEEVNTQIELDITTADSALGKHQSDPREGGATPGESGVELARAFFPCNREDALVLLGGLCISAFFPDSSIMLAVQAEGIALVENGLRVSEEGMLHGGRPERFPVLVQVNRKIACGVPRVIEYADIIRLVFRTQQDADDFRFRPVDEFDTETFQCAVESQRFNLDGEARFQVRTVSSVDAIRIGHVADRLAAGLHFALSVADLRPQCRHSVGLFICGAGDAANRGEEIDFSTVCSALLGEGAASLSRHQLAVIRAFAAAECPSAREMLDGVVGEFANLDAASEQVRAIETRWAGIARDVIRSKVALDGDILADDKSVLLRAALLGLSADTPDALCSFLDAENPSGPRVTTSAAFLSGLKIGLTGMPWNLKRQRASVLSRAYGILVRTIATNPENLKQIVVAARDDDEHASELTISIGELVLSNWAVEEQHVSDAVQDGWPTDFVEMGYDIAEPGPSPYSWIVHFPEDRRIELILRQVSGMQFPVMRFRMDDGAKLRKQKDLAEFFKRGSRLWYLRADEAGIPCLECDFPALPDKSAFATLSTALNAVLEFCIVGKKQARPRRKVASGKRHDLPTIS